MIEELWAIKAFEHAEIYFNVSIELFIFPAVSCVIKFQLISSYWAQWTLKF